MSTEMGATQKLSAPVSTMEIFDKLRSGTSGTNTTSTGAGAGGGDAGRNRPPLVPVKPEPGTLARGSSSSSGVSSAAGTGTGTGSAGAEDSGLAVKIDLTTLRKLMDLLRLDAVGVVTKVLCAPTVR
jgi:hypothetical protein